MLVYLVLLLVPLATCHYEDAYVHEHKTRDGNYNYDYDNGMNNNGGDYPSSGYDTRYGNEAYGVKEEPKHQTSFKASLIRPAIQIPQKYPSWMMDLFHKVAKQVLTPSPEKTVNLKVSGKIELVKSYKDIGHPWMHGPHPPGPGHHWSMTKHGRGPLGKMMWFNHVVNFHKHLHDLEEKQEEEEIEDLDEDEEEEDEHKDHEEFIRSKWHSKKTCPFWLTKQFLKLCKCPTINNKLESVLGHPLKPFPTDPMQVFNNTPGMKEIETGDINGLMFMIPEMEPKDLKKLFFAGMIKSLCAKAKSFVQQVDVIEKGVRARVRAAVAHSSGQAPGGRPEPVPEGSPGEPLMD